MRKSSFMLAMILAVLMTMVFPAVAAELHEPHQNTTVGDFNDGVDCKKGEEVGVWHFVANQTDGAAAGTLLVKLSDGTMVYDSNPTKVNRNNQQWWVRAPADAELESAYSLLGDGSGMIQMEGRLVVSEAYCAPIPKK